MILENKSKGKRASSGLNLFITTLKQARPLVWVTLVVAILGVLNYEGRFIPLIIDTKFTRAANALINQVLITYITGTFFYFLIEMLPKTKKKIAIYTSVGNAMHFIRARIDCLVNEIGKASPNQEQEFNLTKELFSKHCNTIDLDSQVVKVWFYPDLTFRQFVVKICDDVKATCDEILSFQDVFDERWASSLTKINGLCSSIVKSLEIRYKKPQVNDYYILGLYTERLNLDKLMSRYSKDFDKLARLSSNLFIAPDLKLPVSRQK
jgi:hypothetical protein